MVTGALWWYHDPAGGCFTSSNRHRLPYPWVPAHCIVPGQHTRFAFTSRLLLGKVLESLSLTTAPLGALTPRRHVTIARNHPGNTILRRRLLLMQLGKWSVTHCWHPQNGLESDTPRDSDRCHVHDWMDRTLVFLEES